MVTFNITNLYSNILHELRKQAISETLYLRFKKKKKKYHWYKTNLKL